MAKYNEWLTLSDLESIPGLPEWIKKSISGEYLSSRIKATMTGELTSAELAEIRKNVSRPDSSVKHLMTEIEKSLNGWGYDVRFNLTENGLFSFAFRPKGVSGDWKPGMDILLELRVEQDLIIWLPRLKGISVPFKKPS